TLGLSRGLDPSTKLDQSTKLGRSRGLDPSTKLDQSTKLGRSRGLDPSRRHLPKEMNRRTQTNRLFRQSPNWFHLLKRCLLLHLLEPGSGSTYQKQSRPRHRHSRLPGPSRAQVWLSASGSQHRPAEQIQQPFLYLTGHFP